MNSINKLLTKFLLFLNSLVARGPKCLSLAAGRILAFIWIDVFSIRKQIILNNLAIAFPQMSEGERKKIGRDSVYAMAKSAMLSLRVPYFNQKTILQTDYVFHGLEHLHRAREKNKGVLLMSLHLGSGDLAATGMSIMNIPIHIITKRFKSKWLDDFWFQIRSAQGVRFIEAHSPTNAFEILKALKKNETVAFVIDQFMGKPYGIKTTFFGKETGSPMGLAVFYLKTKAPVVPIYTYFDREMKIHVVLEPELDLTPFISDDKEESYYRLTEHFNRQLEKYITQHPTEWMWVHRRWKEIK